MYVDARGCRLQGGREGGGEGGRGGWIFQMCHYSNSTNITNGTERPQEEDK